jgi:hypothetical protein
VWGNQRTVCERCGDWSVRQYLEQQMANVVCVQLSWFAKVNEAEHRYDRRGTQAAATTTTGIHLSPLANGVSTCSKEANAHSTCRVKALGFQHAGTNC